ncbi:MAG TPA: FAD-binding oxidoreductase [Hyphomicrobiaceae bacterium]|nr:FAD-binding oxidoreductase [Hyphomicrobiaceae bacterium]
MSVATAKFVICGAGIAGVAAVYQLAVVHGCRNVVLVEEGNPLSLTSDKSTEAYRNWWPGPDQAMTAFMNRSIDLIEGLAQTTGNRFNLNRRGYVFASADPAKADWLIENARVAEARGAGAVRVHGAGSRSYVSAAAHGFESPLTGADVITDRALIREYFPYLAPETRCIAHVRRAGWLSAQQLGMTMLDAAREHGVRTLRGRVTGAETQGGRLVSVNIESGEGRANLEATHLVLAAGPKISPLAASLGIELPLFAERHLKISIQDTLGAVPRHAPMLIWLDPQRLPWNGEEREALAADDSMRWLTEPFPAGVHGRPDGGPQSATLLILYNYHVEPSDVVYPLAEDENYGEIALRGMSTIVPALGAYLDKGVRPYIDGGYYMKTRENRPLIGPSSVDGIYLSCGYSGFGIMSSMAGGELVARHMLGLAPPDYAPAFLPTRYSDPAYQALLANWGDGAQL